MSMISSFQSPQFFPKLSYSTNPSSMLPSNSFEGLGTLSASPQQPTNPSVDSSQQVNLPDILSFIIYAITDFLQGQENFNQQSVNTDTENEKEDKKADKKSCKKAGKKSCKKHATKVDNKDLFVQNQNIDNKNEIIGINKTSSNTSGDNSINKVINELEKSSTGQKLMNDARNKGVEITFGKVDSGTVGLFEQKGSESKITLKDTGDVTEMVKTLAHELGHSITREDGNSIEEEIKMEQLADKVAIEAGLSDRQQSYDSLKKRIQNSSIYKDLDKNNDVSNTLAQYDISLPS